MLTSCGRRAPESCATRKTERSKLRARARPLEPLDARFGTVRTRLGAAALLAALLIVPAAAQETPALQADTEAETRVDEEVVVRGRRLSEIEFDIRLYVRDFLESVTAPARGRGYARWNRRVCIGVHNLENTAAQYIVDRISSLALDVGLETGEPGCSPHVNILFATDAAEMASLMVESQPRVFRPAGGNAGTDLGLVALDDFVKSDRAVRWWHVSLPVDARTGVVAMAMPGQGAPTIAVAGASRIHSGIRDDLQYVIIIVDATKLSGKTWQQLADYLAVVSLAQIDPKTDPEEYDSILNLFTNPVAYSGLTDWDRSFVRALYAFNPERIPRLQGSDIVRRIVRQELAGGE